MKRRERAELPAVTQVGLSGVQLDETVVEGPFAADAPFSVRALSELKTPAGVLVKDVFFEGLDVLRCYEGAFRFTVERYAPIELPAGYALVIYPGRRVTIEALAAKNRLDYCILGGSRVVAYFARLGFEDRAHGPSPSQEENFRFVREQARSPEAKTAAGRAAMVLNLAHMFETLRESAMKEGRRLYLEAVRQIFENVQAGEVSVEAVTSALGVSRTRLFAAFKAAGSDSPGEVIRVFQLYRAKELLAESANTNIDEIARQTGFSSASHFASFMKRMTGRTPRQLRG